MRLLVSVVPLGALAALGGAYPSATVPILVASAAAFLFSRARIIESKATRWLDASLVAVLIVILLQAVPLPRGIVAGLSPQTATFEQMLTLHAPAGTANADDGQSHPLSINPYATREGLATAASCILLFWAARATFARGGVRLFAKAIAWSGFLVALVALVQRATAPKLLLWTWTPIDPGAQPYGPFVNRNHFATWLLMATALTTGYLVTRLRAHGFERHRSHRLLLRDLLADGNTIVLTGCVSAMLLALVGSLSRAALLGAAAAAVFAVGRARRTAGGDVSTAFGGAIIVAALSAAVWVNRDALLGRLGFDFNQPGRLTIWRETMPVISDFWLTGTGVGAYGTAMLRYQVTRPGTLFNQAHNEYLQLAAEGGLLLVAAAAMALWYWLRAARQGLSGGRDRLHWIRLGAAAGICGVAVQGLFEAGLRMPANGLLLAVLAAMVTVRNQTTEDDSGRDC